MAIFPTSGAPPATNDKNTVKFIIAHLICARSAITAYLDASDGNIRAAQSLSRHANLNTLNRYDDNRHKYQAVATNMLADLV